MKLVIVFAIMALICMICAANLAQTNIITSMVFLVAMVLFIVAGVVTFLRSR